MPRRTSTSSNWIVATMTAAIALYPVASAQAGSATGAATEWTQLANNAQLIDLLKSSGLQVDNQLTQISQLAEQIQNQLNIYENMLQNTAQLPDHIWGQVESDLNQLRDIIDQGQSISFSMGSADDVLKQRFQSYADLQTAAGNGTGTWSGSGSGIGTGIGWMILWRASAAVYQRFHAMTHMPSQISTPPAQRTMYIGWMASRLLMNG